MVDRRLREDGRQRRREECDCDHDRHISLGQLHIAATREDVCAAGSMPNTGVKRVLSEGTLETGTRERRGRVSNEDHARIPWVCDPSCFVGLCAIAVRPVLTVLKPAQSITAALMAARSSILASPESCRDAIPSQ